jgi:TPR repeat protein
VHFVSIQSFLSKLFGRKPAPTFERAEEAYRQARQADAAGLFRAPAEQKNVQARLRLGQLYERGEGVLQNFVEAVAWFRLAAEQGSLPAMSRLGEIYLTGLAAPGTATPAARVRLEQNQSEGSLLSRLYPQGLAVRQDPEQAAKWNARAAAAGHAGAQALTTGAALP